MQTFTTRKHLIQKVCQIYSNGASLELVQSLRGSPCAKNVREVSLHFHELDHVA